MSTVPGTITVKSAVHGVSPVNPAPDGPLQSWQRDLAGAVRCRTELLQRLRLDPRDLSSPDSPGLPSADSEPESSFPLLVPLSYLNRMRPGDPQDPLLRQVWPTSDENQHVPGFVADAVGDLAARSAPGLLHKYQGRALLIAAGACAIHCRYCFRREYPYQHDPKRLDEWTPALETIAADTSIHEVILSGGDPLMLSDARLSTLCQLLDRIPHVERIRIHSRMPVVLPSRVTPELLGLSRSLRAQLILVIHANHPQEISEDCLSALRQLVRSGLPVLNQAVLLKGINDDVRVLAELCRRLVNMGVMPYYLHQLDRVHGTAHFEVPASRGREIIEQLTALLPGYAVPRYVREVAGADSKTPV